MVAHVIERASLAERFAEDDVLALAANSGDRTAESRYLQRNIGFLRAMAHRMARGAIDPDDLVGDSVLALLSRWRTGTGPDYKANAYVLQSMRNRLIDERRSPRSRTVSLREVEHLLPAFTIDSRAIDEHRERTLAISALRSLPHDQQFVILATVVEGRKPADLVAELDRSASAISSLVQRAKVSLRRATLKALLEDQAPATCRVAASRLSRGRDSSATRSGSSVAARHARECARCARVWELFDSGVGATDFA